MEVKSMITDTCSMQKHTLLNPVKDTFLDPVKHGLGQKNHVKHMVIFQCLLVCTGKYKEASIQKM